ncbi:MAG: hypothetical protein DRJ42_13215 [Deltaproteobacteria bacterium]|nr:MAG: hypothetical protein DRJ42_13215 [Deltaproteobacteria bacterium]
MQHTIFALLLAAAMAWFPGPSSVAEAQAPDHATEHDPNPVSHEPAHHEPPGVEDESLDHRMQVGLRVGAGMPYVFAIRYGDGPRCDTAGENFCRDFGTPVLDVELGFGVTDSAEVSFSSRFGLTESDVSGSHPIQLGLGIRGFLSPEELFKLYIGGRVILDLTQSSLPNWNDIDFGVRGEFGAQFDLLRHLGLYIQIGASIAFIRAFSITADLTAGVQVRFP